MTYRCCSGKPSSPEGNVKTFSSRTSNDPKRVEVHFTLMSSRNNPGSCRKQATQCIDGHYVRLRGQPVLFLNPHIDLFPMYRNCRGRFDSEADLTAFQPKHDHTDVRTDRDTFSTSTG